MTDKERIAQLETAVNSLGHALAEAEQRASKAEAKLSELLAEAKNPVVDPVEAEALASVKAKIDDVKKKSAK